MMTRLDDPEKVMRHADRFHGGKALIVLGGYSASGWEALREEIKPDVILIGNGVNSIVQGADYWMCAENMTPWAARENPRSISLMQMFYRDAGAKIKLVSHRSWHLLKDATNCIRIQRDKNHGSWLGKTPDYFSFRDYGGGFLNGWLFQHKEAGVEVHVGTVGTHLLHMAGILGCSEVHTIGFDLCFKEKDKHHSYSYPTYQPDRYRTEKMFVQHAGLDTQLVWIEAAQFLREIQPLFIRDGLNWIDHSTGLLQAMDVVWR
jgi:hypothetical protein